MLRTTEIPRNENTHGNSQRVTERRFVSRSIKKYICFCIFITNNNNILRYLIIKKCFKILFIIKNNGVHAETNIS